MNSRHNRHRSRYCILRRTMNPRRPKNNCSNLNPNSSHNPTRMNLSNLLKLDQLCETLDGIDHKLCPKAH